MMKLIPTASFFMFFGSIGFPSSVFKKGITSWKFGSFFKAPSALTMATGVIAFKSLPRWWEEISKNALHSYTYLCVLSLPRLRGRARLLGGGLLLSWLDNPT